jgi:hypothetical protein
VTATSTQRPRLEAHDDRRHRARAGGRMRDSHATIDREEGGGQYEMHWPLAYIESLAAGGAG